MKRSLYRLLAASLHRSPSRHRQSAAHAQELPKPTKEHEELEDRSRRLGRRRLDVDEPRRRAA